MKPGTLFRVKKGHFLFVFGSKYSSDLILLKEEEIIMLVSINKTEMKFLASSGRILKFDAQKAAINIQNYYKLYLTKLT
jgi:hypothetical protein